MESKYSWISLETARCCRVEDGAESDTSRCEVLPDYNTQLIDLLHVYSHLLTKCLCLNGLYQSTLIKFLSPLPNASGRSAVETAVLQDPCGFSMIALFWGTTAVCVFYLLCYSNINTDILETWKINVELRLAIIKVLNNADTSNTPHDLLAGMFHYISSFSY